MLLFIIISIPLLYIAIQTFSIVRTVRRQKTFTSLLPGPKGWPIVGNLFQISRSAEDMPRIVVQRANEYSAKGHDLTRVWLLHKCFITPNNGRTAKAILDSSEEITKGNEYDILLPWLGQGLLLKKGEEWRQRRHLLTPTFHFTQLDTYINSMNRHSRLLVDEILVDQIGKKIDIYPLIKLCTLDIICETAMGKDLGSQFNPNQPYVTSVKRMVQLVIEFLAKPYYWSKTIRTLSGKQQEFQRHAEVARAFTKNVIDERKEVISKGEVEMNKRAFLDVLIAQNDNNHLSDEEIQEEVDTFMFEGHDTTASGLAWTIWCLACNPEIQDKAAKEVLDLFEDDVEAESTRNRLQSMNYLDQCIKEAMRLFPPVPIVMRTLQNDFQCGDFRLPKGATVNICPLAIHRNETVFENAFE